ncbi:MAG: hypothetical protein SFU98_10490 [Leptospiraceae bacterium]|nr:hypothetical protein [Leptospiraceae bacterium]
MDERNMKSHKSQRFFSYLVYSMNLFILVTCTSTHYSFVKKVNKQTTQKNEKILLSLVDRDNQILKERFTKKINKFSYDIVIDRRSNISIQSDYTEEFKGFKSEYENSFLYYLSLGILPEISKISIPLNFTLTIEEPNLQLIDIKVEKAILLISKTSIIPSWNLDSFTSEELKSYDQLDTKNFKEYKDKELIALMNLQINSLIEKMEKNQDFRNEILKNSKIKEFVLPYWYIDFNIQEYFPKELLKDNLSINSVVVVEVEINEFDKLESYEIVNKSNYSEINSKIPEILNRIKWESGYEKGKKKKMKVRIPFRFKSRE